MPIWENVADPEDRMSIANLDELFHLTKTGSKNLTKNIFIRHGRTNFNDEKKVDALGDSVLTDLGQEQSQNLVAKLEHLKAEKSELIFVLSPLQRTRQTIKPTLLSRFSESEVTAEKNSIMLFLNSTEQLLQIDLFRRDFRELMIKWFFSLESRFL